MPAIWWCGLFTGTQLSFTGDAERRSEGHMIETGRPWKPRYCGWGTTVHALRPPGVSPGCPAELAVYSAGLDNSFGHPHQEVINRLKILEVQSMART